MKKSFILSIVAVAGALAMTGCNKEAETQEPTERVVQFTINASAPETRTFVVYNANKKEYVPNWNENDAIGVFFNNFSENASLGATFYNTWSDGEDASFSGQGTVSSSEQTIYAFYPAGQFAKAYDGNVVGITIPEVQKPTETSFDKNADILVSKPYPITISKTSVVIEDMQFARVLSMLKLVIKDGTNNEILSSDNIKSVTLTTKTSSNEDGEFLTGRFKWDFDDRSSSISAGSNKVTADFTPNSIALNGTNPIYLMLYPTTLPQDSKLEISISTDKHEITKTATLSSKAFEFSAGVVKTLNISITDNDTIEASIPEPQGTGWFLVQDASWLKVGDKIVITNTVPNQALGSQNGNYRNRVSVTKADNNLDPKSATQLELVAGKSTGTFALKAGSKYLAYGSSGNTLVENDEITAISSWNISVTTSATSIQNSSYTGYYIQYNGNNNQERFSCYTGTQSPIHIYKQYTVPDTRDEAGIAWDDDEGVGDLKNATLNLPSLNNPNNLTISYSSSDATVATVAANAHTITLRKVGETQIHATFDGDDDYKPADVYYTLTVQDTRDDVTLSFGTASYSLTIGTDDYEQFNGQTVSASPSVAVTYAITGAAVGELNTTSGVIALDNNTTGTATITASFDGDATHKPATSADYTIVVSPAPPSGTPGSESFDLSKKTYTTGNDLVTWTGTAITISNSGTNATNYLGGDSNDRTSSRFYTGNILEIAPNQDYVITSIVFTAASENYASVLSNSSWSNATTSVSGSTVTVTPSNGANAVSAVVGGTCGFTGITVNYVYTGIPIPTISMNTSAISDIAAAGITTTANNVYNLLNDASNNDVTITCDGTIVTSAEKNTTAGSIDYTVAPNTSGARNGWIKVKYSDEEPHQITVSQLAGIAAPTVGTVLFSDSFDSAADGSSAQVYYSTGVAAYNAKNYGGTITYTRSNNSDVQIENAATAGGSAKQIMINKNGGSLTISGIKTYGATKVNVSFKYICSKSNAPITSSCGSTNSGSFSSTTATTASYDATVSGDTFTLVIQKTSNANSTAARFDDIVITVAE